MLDKEEKQYHRDRIFFRGLMIFMALLGCAALYISYEALMPKPPLPPEDDLASPTFFIPPDNTKELNLESNNDQN